MGGRERRLEQLARLEAADVGAVALPHLEDAGESERPDRLTQRVPREPELGGEVGLAREPRSGTPLAADDQLADRLDRVLGDPSGAGHYPPSILSLA